MLEYRLCDSPIKIVQGGQEFICQIGSRVGILKIIVVSRVEIFRLEKIKTVKYKIFKDISQW